MTVDELIEKIKNERISDLSDEDRFPELELVFQEDTNPRRDYLGSREVYRNKDDNRFIEHEFVKYDYEDELWLVREVVPEEVTTTAYKAV